MRPLAAEYYIRNNALLWINKNFKKFKFPIISGADFGHCTPNIPIPYGKLASIDGNKVEFKILESIF